MIYKFERIIWFKLSMLYQGIMVKYIRRPYTDSIFNILREDYFLND